MLKDLKLLDLGINKFFEMFLKSVTGYIGIVKDATETTARVELTSSCQTISVDKTRLSNVTLVSLFFTHV